MPQQFRVRPPHHVDSDPTNEATISSTTFVQDTLAPADAIHGEFTLASVGATSFDYYWNWVRAGNLPVNSTTGVPAWTGDLTLPDSAVSRSSSHRDRRRWQPQPHLVGVLRP